MIQGNVALRLRTHADAVSWNAALPCAGRIVSLAVRGDTATATFLLGDRRGSPCDGPGFTVRALFKVHAGKIVLWHQLDSKEPDTQTA